VVTGKQDIQLTYDLPKAMSHDEAVNVFERHGLTNALLGVGVRGKLAVQLTDAAPKDIADVQIVAVAAGMTLVAAVNLAQGEPR
jgi:DNA-directed RNA polymerase subunit F